MMDAGPQAVEGPSAVLTDGNQGPHKRLDQLDSGGKPGELKSLQRPPQPSIQVDCGPPAPCRYQGGEKKNWVRGIHAADGRLLGEIMWRIAFPNIYVHVFEKICVLENR